MVKALLDTEGRNLKGAVKRVTGATRLKFGGTRSRKQRRLVSTSVWWGVPGWVTVWLTELLGLTLELCFTLQTPYMVATLYCPMSENKYFYRQMHYILFPPWIFVRLSLGLRLSVHGCMLQIYPGEVRIKINQLPNDL